MVRSRGRRRRTCAPVATPWPLSRYPRFSRRRARGTASSSRPELKRRRRVGARSIGRPWCLHRTRGSRSRSPLSRRRPPSRPVRFLGPAPRASSASRRIHPGPAIYSGPCRRAYRGATPTPWRRRLGWRPFCPGNRSPSARRGAPGSARTRRRRRTGARPGAWTLTRGPGERASGDWSTWIWSKARRGSRRRRR